VIVGGQRRSDDLQVFAGIDHLVARIDRRRAGSQGDVAPVVVNRKLDTVAVAASTSRSVELHVVRVVVGMMQRRRSGNVRVRSGVGRRR